jgi:predicted GTPase
LEKKIRDRFGMVGNPIKLVLRSDAGRSGKRPGRSGE